jgi:FKBP-type peptidyl-prolyl cis-trans isomerase FkpA
VRLNCRFPLACTIAGLVVLSAVAAGCNGSPLSPSNDATYSQTDLRLGTGASAVPGSVVAVHYAGWLYDGSQPDHKGAQFNSSVGQEPFSFTLGAGTVITGWERGIVNMQVGGVRRLVLPPSLAYGASRYGLIPPNATLVFEVELVDVQ